MREASAELTARIQEGSTTLCRLWTVERADGAVFRFTDSVEPVFFGPVGEEEEYRSDISFTSSAVSTSKTYSSQQSVTITVVMDDAGISEAALRQRKFDSASGLITVVDYRFPEYGGLDIFSGTFGQITLTDKLRATIDLIPSSSLAAGGIGVGAEVYSRTCRASLGDAQCKFDIEAGKVSFTVQSASGGSIVTDTVNQDPNRWVLGFVKWTSGPNEGTISKVQASDPGTKSIFLASAPLFAAQPGDTGAIYQGCDKIVTTCRDKFNNVFNFRGEPAVPDGITPGSNYSLFGGLAL